MNVYLNTFKPICVNKFGRNNIVTNRFRPFIDGFCRREADFQYKFPAITKLCIPSKLVPTLKNGNLIIYLTKNVQYCKNIFN